MAKKTSFSSTLLKAVFSWVMKYNLLIVAFFAIFFLRFPTLFEPLVNKQEAFLINYASGLLPAETKLAIWEALLVGLLKLGFIIFGVSFWSVRFILLIYILITVGLVIFLFRKYLGKKKIFLPTLALVTIFGLPSFGTNKINFLAYTPLALLVSIFLIQFSLRSNKLSKQILTALPFLLGLMMVVQNGFSNSFRYYQNFLGYSWAKVSNHTNADENYFNSFGTNVSQIYSLAFYIKNKTSANETIYVLGDQLSIYFLASRKAASSHLNWEDSTKRDLIVTDIVENKPKYLLKDRKIKETVELDRIINKFYNLSARENDIEIYVLKSV